MPARSKARKRAVDVLFEADLRQRPAVDVLDELTRRVDYPLNPYVTELINGIEARRSRIDDLLATYSESWPLDRMPVVDRNILRIGTWELLWGDVPDAVVQSEAADLASSLSTEESASFVNGLLSKVIEVRPHLALG